MRDLEFRADGMALSRTGGLASVTAGSSGYLRAVFDLSDDYDGRKTAASFRGPDGIEHAALLVDGACDVPPQVTGGSRWSVSLVCAGEGDRFCTNAVTVRQEVPHGHRG